jgi:hypothetical protein
LIQQYLLGASSFWYPYIATLPQPEHVSSWAIPAFWPEDDVLFLTGTNAGVAVTEMRENAKREFKQARKALQDAGVADWQAYTRVLYNWAFSIFASRSFRPSTVISSERWSQFKNGLISVDKDSDDSVEMDDFSVLMPMFDIANHGITSKVEWDCESDPTTCGLKVLDEYLPGQQVFNNYGKKTNSELLLGYGFVVPETEILHNDYVHVRKRTSTRVENPGPVEVPAGNAKPTDFLVSLRPMRDPSSFVGRARQRVPQIDGFSVLPEFTNIDDSLIWDLVVSMITEEERQVLHEMITAEMNTSDVGVDNYLHLLLRSPTDTRLEELVSRIKDMLLAKIGFDFDQLQAAEEAAAAENDEMGFTPQNSNQELASYYRTQCERVLEAAIVTLTSDDDSLQGQEVDM